MMPESVRIVEVGPRDGLQNETRTLPVSTRVELIAKLAACGLSDIEAGAFVSPKWVAQMAQSAQVLQQAQPLAGTARLWALVPNGRGAQDAVAAGARHLAVFIAASETFSQKNTNANIAQSLERVQEVRAALSQRPDIQLRGYISCVLGCPYEGAVDPGRVADLAQQLLALGCQQVSLGDTIGTGTLASTRTLLQACRALPTAQLAAHFHDTYGQALANLTAALEFGIRTIDSSVGGLGGCPYAPGARGNVATEAVVRFCEGQGLRTGVDPAALSATSQWIKEQLTSCAA